MPKKLLIIVFTIFCFTILTSNDIVKAYNNDEVILYANASESNANCEGILGDPKDDESFAYMLQQIFNIVRYLGPLLCLIFSTIDFVKAAASQEKENLTKAAKTTGKRLILAMLIFFLPLLINFLFPLLGWYGTCGIE